MALDDPAMIALLAVMGLYAVLLAGTVGVVVRRRHLQPLRFRDPYLLIATVTSAFLGNLMVLQSQLAPVPYCSFLLLAYIPFLSNIVLVCARFWKLLLAYQITQARISEAKSSWILRNTWLMSSKNLWRLSAAISLLLFIIVFAAGMSSPGCTDNQNFLLFVAALIALYVVAIALMTFKLRRIHDGFFVVKELSMLGVVILISDIMLFTIRLDAITIALFSIVQMIIQTWYPIWKSYQMAQPLDRPQTGDGVSDNTSHVTLYSTAGTKSGRLKSRMSAVALNKESTFEEILRHPDGFEAMKKFLILEFSVENLLCWQQLHANKRERRPEQVQANFRAIYDTFIRKGSQNEVNIHAELRKHFKEVAEGRPISQEAIAKMKAPKYDPGSSTTPDPDTDVKLRLLKQLHFEMIRLMELDSYQRFKRSAEYENLIRADPEHRTVMDRS